MTDTAKDMIDAIHAIFNEDLTDTETVARIREVLYGEEDEEDEEEKK